MSWLEQLLTKPPEYLYALAVLVGVATVAALVYLLIKLVKGRGNGNDTMSTALALDHRVDVLETEVAVMNNTLGKLASITDELQKTNMRISRELGVLTGILQEHNRRMNGNG